jgi:hypothetical protein
MSHTRDRAVTHGLTCLYKITAILV